MLSYHLELSVGILVGVVTGISAGDLTGISAGDLTGISAGDLAGTTVGEYAELSVGILVGVVTGISAGDLVGTSVGEYTALSFGISVGALKVSSKFIAAFFTFISVILDSSFFRLLGWPQSMITLSYRKIDFINSIGCMQIIYRSTLKI